MSKFNWGWGHSFQNYLLMFDLQETDLQEPILDVASGASSFNAEMHQRGYQAISSDPLYAYPFEDLQQKVERMLDNLQKRILENESRFIWQREGNTEDLMLKQHAMANIFLKDFPVGVEEGRYVAHALPELPFEDYQFSLALCANFLFDGPYHENFDFQLASLLSLSRVAREVRIFPLLNDEGDISQNIAPLMSLLQIQNFGVEIREVPFHLQKKGNAMLRVWSNTCTLDVI
jgi:hypothetical protein